MISETYIIPFLFLIAITYSITMIILQFAVREYAFAIDFRQMLEGNHMCGVGVPQVQPQNRQTMENYRNTWISNYSVFRDPNYIFLWGILSRVFSTIHAIVMTVTVIYLVIKYGITSIWDYNFYLLHPEGALTCINLNAFMLAYLSVDVVFLIIHYVKLSPGTKVPDDNFFFAVTHHIVGALSMLQFIQSNQVQFNSLYFSLTEVSTISLNVAWLSIKLGWDKPEKKKDETNSTQRWPPNVDPQKLHTIYKAAGYTTFLLFFLVRILGSFFLIAYVYINVHRILAFPFYRSIFGFVGNGIVVGLNYYWFYKLSLKAFGKSG